MGLDQSVYHILEKNSKAQAVSLDIKKAVNRDWHAGVYNEWCYFVSGGSFFYTIFLKKIAKFVIFRFLFFNHFTSSKVTKPLRCKWLLGEWKDFREKRGKRNIEEQSRRKKKMAFLEYFR